MKISKISKVILILAAAVAAIALYVFIMSFMLAGCGLSGAPYGHYEYYIDIKGLANCTGGPSTDIYLPVPVFNGQPAYASEDFSLDIPGNGTRVWKGHGFDEYNVDIVLNGDWKLNVSDTAFGRMLVLHTENASLTDVRLTLINDYMRIQRRSDRGSDRVMSPLFNVSGQDDVNYTTCMIVDGNLLPAQGSSGIIVCNLTLIIEEGKDGKRFDVSARKSIIPAEPGIIPLNISIAVSPDSRIAIY